MKLPTLSQTPNGKRIPCPRHQTENEYKQTQVESHEDSSVPADVHQAVLNKANKMSDKQKATRLQL